MGVAAEKGDDGRSPGRKTVASLPLDDDGLVRLGQDEGVDGEGRGGEGRGGEENGPRPADLIGGKGV